MARTSLLVATVTATAAAMGTATAASVTPQVTGNGGPISASHSVTMTATPVVGIVPILVLAVIGLAIFLLRRDRR